MTIDPQYTVGFSWARQYGFRVTKDFNNKVWAGFSVENSQETVTTHGNTAGYLVAGLAGYWRRPVQRRDQRLLHYAECGRCSGHHL